MGEVLLKRGLVGLRECPHPAHVTIGVEFCCPNSMRMQHGEGGELNSITFFLAPQLAQVVRDSSPYTPFVFVLSPGVDPTTNLADLAKSLKIPFVSGLSGVVACFVFHPGRAVVVRVLFGCWITATIES